MNKTISIKLLSPLEKIYHNDKLPDCDYKGFSMLKNEKKSFQVAVECSEEFIGEISVSSKIDNIKLYSVEHIKSDFPMAKDADDYYRFSDDGYYPDLLLPLDKYVQFKKGNNIFWIEVIPDGSFIGTDEIEISVNIENDIHTTKFLTVEIINYELDFKDFIYTSWFHTDCLMSYYNVEAFSEEYWRITRNFLKTANEYGMNCVFTPIFTPPLDTEVGKERPTVQLVDVIKENGNYSFNFDKLSYWIKMSKECGIKYFELSHFFTQWGACYAPKIMATVDGEYKQIFGWKTKSTSKEYKHFLSEFSKELKNYIEKNNLKEYIILHVSDEPSLYVLPSYTKASRLIHKLFKGYKIVDALSDIWYYRLGIVTTPIPSNDHIDKFIGKTNELWTYYCSGQNKKYVSNRFFCNDSIRTRVIGYQLFKYDVKGFLQWGYNFYYTQLSKKLIDPYKVSDAGGKFPSGDSYVVYPAKDGTANHSIRLKVFYDGLQDMAALNALAKLTNKDYCLNIIECDGKNPITFSIYPHSDEWILETREKINSAIKENIK